MAIADVGDVAGVFCRMKLAGDCRVVLYSVDCIDLISNNYGSQLLGQPDR